VLYWVFAVALLVSNVAFKKNLMRSLLEEKLALPLRVWNYVNLSWSLFFAVLGVLNLYVALNYPTASWVNFKLFGTSGLMLLFVLLQAMVLSKYVEEDKERN
jgi:intracellular septation protein